MRKRKDKLVSVYLMFGLILLVIGFSYAFFIYNKRGLYTHTITGGKMKVIYDETTGNNITIENAYPLTDKEAETKSLEFEFTITGYNESDKNVYYAIEIAHGEDVQNKNRFLDSDMKLTLFENDDLVFENEIFNNLDNQDIYYNYFKAGTSSQSPTINNYKMRLWINDYVYISDTIESDLIEWDDNDWNWIDSIYGSVDATDEAIYNACPDFYDGYSDECSLSDLGISVYTSDEFANSYANFKVNVRANLDPLSMGMIVYDPNGGIFDVEKTSVLTNMITNRKPVIEGKGFLGWSEDKNATTPEYYSGDYYEGEGVLLYAVYSDTRNVMGKIDECLYEGDLEINRIYFVNLPQEEIDEIYDMSQIKADLTLNNQGCVKAWVTKEYNYENDYYDGVIYIASEGTTYLSDGKELFFERYTINNIYFENVDTSMVKDMSFMFGSYSTQMSIEKIDLSSFNTSNVTNMEGMFGIPGVYGLTYLEEIDLSNWNTSNVTNMTGMFSRCSNLDKLEINHFDTSNVTNMGFMFYRCCNLLKLDLSNFVTNKVTNMASMFNECLNLTTLNVSNFNLRSIENIESIFSMCENLSEIDVSNWNTSNLTDMSEMFYGCANLETIDVSNFDTSNVTNMSNMFGGCSFKQIDLRNFDTNQVTDMSGMFSGFAGITLDLSYFNTSNVVDMSSMFSNCKNLSYINFKNWDTSKVTDMSSMFSGCNSFEMIDLSHFDTSNVINMKLMFAECSGLKTLDVNNLETESLTNTIRMFEGCTNLTSLDFSNWDTTNLKNICSDYFSNMYQYNGEGMFKDCSNLTQLDLSSFDFSTITYYSYAFYNMSSNLTIYVATESDKNLILGIKTSYRPSWTTDNVIIKS